MATKVEEKKVKTTTKPKVDEKITVKTSAPSKTSEKKPVVKKITTTSTPKTEEKATATENKQDKSVQKIDVKSSVVQKKTLDLPAEKINTSTKKVKLQNADNFKTRRKTALVLIKNFQQKTGKIIINNIDFEKYFKVSYFKNVILQPFAVLQKNGLKVSHSEFSIQATATGGGFKGQAEAFAKAIAKMLVSTNEEYKTPLKSAGLLSADMRNVERKVPGFRKSRKKEQFSKR